jgi:serine/threonine protein kinase
MSTIINGYRLTKELSTENAGMCQWGFAEKNGHEYFIKQFLQPKYPEDPGRLSPAMVQRMRQIAMAHYAKRKQFYDRLKECRTGNNVVVEEYFRCGNFYYVVTDRVRGPYLTVEQIAALPDEKKRVLLKAVLYNVMQFHEKGIVHADLKPDNIMVRQTAAGYCTAKIIDFDSGFFSYDLPEEIVGDQVYFSPEALLHNMGKESEVTEKADIFALGLIFHQYWTGVLPLFNREEYRYATEALLDGSELRLFTARIPRDVLSLLEQMLSLRAEDRPSAKEAWERLSGDTARTTSASSGRKSGGWYTPTDDDL